MISTQKEQRYTRTGDAWWTIDSSDIYDLRGCYNEYGNQGWTEIAALFVRVFFTSILELKIFFPSSFHCLTIVRYHLKQICRVLQSSYFFWFIFFWQIFVHSWKTTKLKSTWLLSIELSFIKKSRTNKRTWDNKRTNEQTVWNPTFSNFVIHISSIGHNNQDLIEARVRSDWGESKTWLRRE